MKAAAIFRQVAAASLFTWAAAALLTPLLMLFLDVGLAAAAARSCFTVAVFAFGAGAASISGGVSGARPLGPAHSWWKPIPRDNVERAPAPLTLLGVALFVVPQLLAVGLLLFDRGGE